MMFRDLGVGKIVSVIAGAVFLSGCALPVHYQIASWALDGISYVATEKSLTDHGISMVTKKDCALWRGLKGEEVCSEYDDAGTVAIAAAEPDQAPLTDQEDVAALANFETAAGTPEVVPAEITKPQQSSEDGERLMISGTRIWTDRIDADLYFVIGSFSNRNNARRMIQNHRKLGPAVMASRLDGLEIYRVAVGPFTHDQKRTMRVHLKQAGLKNAWAMRVDHRNWMLASPKVLADPNASIAETPREEQPAPKPVVSDEVAETPEIDLDPNLTSEFIDGNDRYLVIGSFAQADNARNYARSKGEFSPRILSAETAEGWRHRVVLGPYAEVETLDVRRRLALEGIDKVWALHLNPDDIVSDTLLAEEPDSFIPDEESSLEEIAEIPEPQKTVSEPEASDDDVGWGINLVKNIIDMFRSADASDVVGVKSSLKS